MLVGMREALVESAKMDEAGGAHLCSAAQEQAPLRISGLLTEVISALFSDS